MLTKLFKLATDMDRKGLYSEADEIDQAIQLLAERAGLKLEDLVSLANELDTTGHVEAATMIDALVVEAAKAKEDKKKKMLKLKEMKKKKEEKEKAKAKREKAKERAEKAMAKKEKADK